MSNNKQSSVEWLAKQLTAKMQMWNSTKNYQEFHIVLEAGEFAKLIEQAKAMQQEQAQLYATFVLKCVDNNLPTITFNDWINLENNEQQ